MHRRMSLAAAALWAGLLVSLPAAAHETDQYTLPIGRDTADLGDHFTEWGYETVEKGVIELNKRIDAAIEIGNEALLRKWQSPAGVAEVVAAQFPFAYFVIEGLETNVNSPTWKRRYPGQVVGYKELFTHAYNGAHLPIDPRQFFKFWFASTINVYGHYFGNDKVGHFTDMGRRYYEDYSKHLAAGMSKEQAEAQMLKIGTNDVFLSESGVLGKFSAGAYSNADLVSNYTGYLFYRNLTEPMVLNGQTRPAMLVRDGEHWALAPHVRRNSDFFSYFWCDGFDEALNPSLFDGSMRGGLRNGIQDRAAALLWRYRDEHGSRRPPQWFEQKQREMRTYWGKDYGYKGEDAELVTLGETCYAPLEREHSLNDYNVTGYTPLQLAVLWGDAARVRKLLDAGANANGRSRRFEVIMPDSAATALHLAARDGHAEIVRLLIERGADVNARTETGATPLHFAADAPQVAAMLLARGANVNAVDVGGHTPLHWAARDERGSALAHMVTAGAKVNAADNHGQTPLHLAALHGRGPAAAELARRGADVNATDKAGVTPLHMAAINGKPDVVLALLESGGRVTVVDDFGATPLHQAARFGHAHAAQMLMQRGAHPATPDMYGTTPLHLASRMGDVPLVALLLEGGADANVANARAMTPLHEAAFSGDSRTVVRLLAAGADAGARDGAGRTPIAAAADMGHHQLAVIMRRGGTQPVFAMPR